MTIRMTLLALAISVVGAGCTGTIHARANASYYGPDMVEIQPGVWVVEDHPYAVFYSDGYYWRYYGGIWYRSNYYDRGFARVHVHYVPSRVRVIDSPRRYVRYRHRGDVRVRRAPASRVRVRDHRSNVRYRRDAARDRRYDRRDAARDRRYDRRDAVRDRRQDRRQRVRDHRQDRRERVRDRRDRRDDRRERVRDHRRDRRHR